MIWVVAVVGIALTSGCFVLTIICLPWRVRLRWRKTWDGPVAVQVRIYSPGRWWQCACDRRSRIIQTLYRWFWPLGGSNPSASLRQARRKVYLLSELSPAISVSVLLNQTQFGFDDPSLTGECLGLLAAMPRSVQQCISITFERVGCRSRGKLDMTAKPIAISWRLMLALAKQNGRIGNHA